MTIVSKANAWPGGSPLGTCFLVLALLLAIAIHWSSPQLPMTDLPAHAGQIMQLHDVWQGKFAWGDFTVINYSTPYVVAYCVSTLLSFLMPIEHAIALMLSLTVVLFTYTYIRLRRLCGANPLLDIIVIPGFFGMSWHWGLYSYIIAIPLGFLFAELCLRYVEGPTLRNAIWLGLCGLVLFATHAIVFFFFVMLGGFYLLYEHRWSRQSLRILVPFLILAYLFVGYLFHVLTLSSSQAPSDGFYRIDRIIQFFTLPLNDNSVKELMYLTLLIMTTALLSGELSTRLRDYVPLAVLILVWAICPTNLLGTYFLYERFSILILPFFALTIRPATKVTALSRTAASLCVALSLVSLGFMQYKVRNFADEVTQTKPLFEAMAPHERVLGIIYDKSSAAMNSKHTYLNYTLWYEAFKHGWVDFNFAYYYPQIIRYKPKYNPIVPPINSLNPETLKWNEIAAERYRYFLVRASKQEDVNRVEQFFADGKCEIKLTHESPPWRLYQRESCASSTQHALGGLAGRGGGQLVQ